MINQPKRLLCIGVATILIPFSFSLSRGVKSRKTASHPRISILLASPDRSESIDDKLVRFMNHDLRSRPMDFFMISVTQLGSWYGAPAVCAGFWFWGGEKGKETGKLSLTALGGSAVITLGLKYMVGRTRPWEAFEDEDWFRPYGPNEHTPSFPSGHTTAAFSLATVIADDYPKYAIPAYVLATLVGISRIYLGQHYPSDVVIGAAIGFGTAKLVIHYKDNILRVIPW